MVDQVPSIAVIATAMARAFGLLGLVVLWLLPALLAARIAERKGRSFAVYLIVSLLIGGPIPLLAAPVVRTRRAT
jgi:hypothetical protein